MCNVIVMDIWATCFRQISYFKYTCKAANKYECQPPDPSSSSLPPTLAAFLGPYMKTLMAASHYPSGFRGKQKAWGPYCVRWALKFILIFRAIFY